LFDLYRQERGSSVQAELVTGFCELGHELSNPVKAKDFLTLRRLSASEERPTGASEFNATYETNVDIKDMKIATQLRPIVFVSYFQKAFNLFINFTTLRDPRVMI
jgi:hypothetical protein